MSIKDEIKTYLGSVEQATREDVITALPHIARNSIIGYLVLLAQKGEIARVEKGIYTSHKKQPTENETNAGSQ